MTWLEDVAAARARGEFLVKLHPEEADDDQQEETDS